MKTNFILLQIKLIFLQERFCTKPHFQSHMFWDLEMAYSAVASFFSSRELVKCSLSVLVDLLAMHRPGAFYDTFHQVVEVT